MENHQGSKKLVWLVRMSAIGDVFIALRTLDVLMAQGYNVVLVTGSALKNLAPCFSSLYAVVFVGESLEVWQGGHQVFVEQFVSGLWSFSEHVVIDVQRTRRSLRALRSVQQHFSMKPKQVIKVKKRTLARWWLVVKARLCWWQKAQNPRLEWESALVQSVGALQLQALKNSGLVCDVDRRIIEEKISGGLSLSLSFVLPSDLKIFLQQEESKIALFVIFLGASGDLKRWPAENVARCAWQLVKTYNVSVVLLGGESEHEFAGQVLSYIEDYAQNSVKKSEEPHSFFENLTVLVLDNGAKIYKAVGVCSLLQSVSILAQASCVITNDSFATHVASYFNNPVVTLFGATSPLFGFVPLTNKSKVLYLQLSCSPCSLHGKGVCRFHNKQCLVGIKGEDVANLAWDLAQKYMNNRA